MNQILYAVIRHSSTSYASEIKFSLNPTFSPEIFIAIDL